MTELETRVRVPFLWGKAVFKKTRWSQINLIVGPNGSGKTILAQELTKQFEEIFVYTGGEVKEKGEFTVVAEPVKKEEKTDEIDEELLNLIAKSGISAKTACEIAARVYPGLKKNDLKKFFMNK